MIGANDEPDGIVRSGVTHGTTLPSPRFLLVPFSGAMRRRACSAFGGWPITDTVSMNRATTFRTG